LGKLGESQLWEFRNSHLGVSGQNDIWVVVMWPSIEYTIRGKVVASPPSLGRGESCEFVARGEFVHQSAPTMQ
jgi:hypothetical protein